MCLPAQNMPKSSTQQIMETPNNSNKRKRQWKCRNYGKEHPRCIEPLKYFNYGKIRHMRRDSTIPAK